jgi:protein-tyrosine phosphatase
MFEKVTQVHLSMIKVLFVCLGNICRSPMAEGIFRQMLKEQGLAELVECDSAGTSGEHSGHPPDPRAIQTALNHDIILDHRARQFRPSDFEKYDYIVAMDLINQADILQQKYRSVSPKAQILLMRKFDHVSENISVPDPYLWDLDKFEEVYEILERSLKNFLAAIKDEYRI